MMRLVTHSALRRFYSAASLCVGLMVATAAGAIECGNEGDRMAISECQLSAKSPQDAEACFDAVVANADEALNEQIAAFEMRNRGVEPGTVEAYNKRMKTLNEALAAFRPARRPICAAEGLVLAQFAACCRARMTRRFTTDLKSVLNWN